MHSGQPDRPLSMHKSRRGIDEEAKIGQDHQYRICYGLSRIPWSRLLSIQRWRFGADEKRSWLVGSLRDNGERCLSGLVVTAGGMGATNPNAERIAASIPLGQRLATEEDVVKAVLFLAADASFMTGQVLVIDGGRSETYFAGPSK